MSTSEDYLREQMVDSGLMSENQFKQWMEKKPCATCGKESCWFSNELSEDAFCNKCFPFQEQKT